MKFICGGQTGVDRAVLDACLENDFPCGGWCPKGRLAEDGPIPEKYPLFETDSIDYAVRTEKNVLAADATVIFFDGEMSGGVLLSKEIAIQYNVPFLEIDYSKISDLEIAVALKKFLKSSSFNVVNFSGPRESESVSAYPVIKKSVIALINLI